MWEKMAFWILQAPYYRMDAVVTVEETWRVWFAQGHTTEKAGPALEPLSLSDSVTEMRRLAHSPESESSSTTTVNCAGNHHCLLAGLQRKGREKVGLFIRFSPLLSTKNVRAMPGNQSNLTFIGEYTYSTQVRTLAVGIYNRLHSLVSDLWFLLGIPVSGMC